MDAAQPRALNSRHIIDRMVELAVAIQQIPAPTFAEQQRAEFVRSLFAAEGLREVSIDNLGNVYARLARTGPPTDGRPSAPLIVCAHLDTVFSQDTELAIRREAGRVFGPGIGDNSVGVAALLGLAWLVRERGLSLDDDVWLVADVREEGLGDLGGMRAVVQRFGGSVRGYLILEGLALGRVYNTAVGVRRYRITAHTAGGHAWSDYGERSAIHELAALITKLTALPLPRQPRTTLNVGTIHGGTGVNVLAADAFCELDLRSENREGLATLNANLGQLIRDANRDRVKVEAELIGERPAGEIAADHPLVRLGMDSLREQSMQPVLTAGSTDANIPLSRGLAAVVLGVTTGGAAHTPHEYIDVEPIASGLEQLVRFLARAWD